jgi:hypothetical protein
VPIHHSSSLDYVSSIGHIAGMSEGHETPPTANKRSGIGFTLIEPVLGALTVIGIGLTVRTYGWQTILTCAEVGIGFLAVVFLWGRCFRVAPGITKAVSIVGVMCVLLSTVVSVWLLESREAARRGQMKTDIRQESFDWEHDLYLKPRSRKADQ